MNQPFSIPAINHSSDQPVETIQKTLDSIVQAVCRLRAENEDLERQKYLCTIHIQQFDCDLEKLHHLYKTVKSYLDSLTRSSNQAGAPPIPPRSGQSPMSKQLRPMPMLSRADVNWNIDSPNPFFQQSGVRLRYALSIESVLCTVRFNGDGSRFAFTDGKNVFVIGTVDGTLVGTCAILRNAQQDEAPARAISFSPDGRYLAVSAPLFAISIFEVATQKHISTLELHKHHVSTIAFFKDGRRMLTGGFDGKLGIWSVPDFKLLKIVPHGIEGSVGKEDMIVAIAMGTDDEYIAVGFMSGMVGMYEPTFSQPMSTFVAHQEYLLNVVVSPQDMIATASHDKTAKLWTLRGVASCRQTLRGHSDFVLTVAFSPQDQIVFTGSKDEKIKCWNQKTGENIFTLNGHKNTLFQIDHHPTDRTILACSGDGLVCVWDYILP
jgi:WD40 repeat protein